MRRRRISFIQEDEPLKTQIASARMRRTSLALAVVVALCGAAPHAASAAAPSFTAVAHPTLLAQGDAVSGSLPMSQPVPVVVALKLRNRAALDALVNANALRQINGNKPQLLSPAKFDSDHAPTKAQAQAVADWLKGMGYRNVAISSNRMLVTADGTAQNAQRAFATTLAQVKTHDGRVAFANTDDVRIPAAMSDKVLAVLGLQTVHQMHTFARPVHHDGAHTLAVTGHFPTEFSSIYGGTGVPAASGITVGIVTTGTLTQVTTDLNTFTTNQGLPAVTTLEVDSGTVTSDTSGLGEWDLDSQDIVGMAGGQVRQLVFYNSHSLNNSDLTADFNAIVAADATASYKTKIINVSLGECETSAQGDGSATAQDQIFETAVSQGQTFSISTGDSGADECNRSHTNTPSWPAASQYVVAVAGTQIDASTTTWASETVWTDSGGSASTFEPQPSWQTPFIPASTPTTKRVVADVAFDADPNSGSKIIVNGALAQYGGTSLAAPIFAGLWARVLQVQGIGFGFAAPVIYALPASDFHDITSGKNSGGEHGVGYSALTGFDFASGRGSMILSSVATDSTGLGNQPPVPEFTFTTTGLSANFTDASTDPDGTIVAHIWTFGDGASSLATNPSHTFAAAGKYSVKEQVRDNGGTVVGKVHNVTVGPVELFKNTGFESGVASPWNMTTGLLANDASRAFAGSWLAEIGNGAATGAHTDHVTQTVTIPAGFTTATLGFELHVTTAETSANPTDVLNVRIYDGAGALLATPASFSNLDAGSGYVLHNVDLSAYIGQTIKVQFNGSNNATLPTTWDLDDVTLMAQ
jgi:PKD repeat protein